MDKKHHIQDSKEIDNKGDAPLCSTARVEEVLETMTTEVDDALPRPYPLAQRLWIDVEKDEIRSEEASNLKSELEGCKEQFTQKQTHNDISGRWKVESAEEIDCRIDILQPSDKVYKDEQERRAGIAKYESSCLEISKIEHRRPQACAMKEQSASTNEHPEHDNSYDAPNEGKDSLIIAVRSDLETCQRDLLEQQSMSFNQNQSHMELLNKLNRIVNVFHTDVANLNQQFQETQASLNYRGDEIISPSSKDAQMKCVVERQHKGLCPSLDAANEEAPELQGECINHYASNGRSQCRIDCNAFREPMYDQIQEAIDYQIEQELHPWPGQER